MEIDLVSCLLGGVLGAAFTVLLQKLQAYRALPAAPTTSATSSSAADAQEAAMAGKNVNNPASRVEVTPSPEDRAVASREDPLHEVLGSSSTEMAPLPGNVMYFLNPKSECLHKEVREIPGQGYVLACGAHQPAQLRRVDLCKYCWPQNFKKFR